MLRLLSTFWCPQDEVHRRLLGSQDPLPSASYQCLHYPCLPTDTKATASQARYALAHLILLLTQPGSSFKSTLDLAVKTCYQTAFSFLPFAGIKSVARVVSLRVTLWSNRTPKIQCPSRKGHFSYCQETVEHIVTDSSLRLRLCSVATQCESIRTQLY